MRHGSLFSGFGGFDLAAEWMGWENVFHCEINPFSRRLLSYYWPNAQSYEDITRTDFTVWRGRVDVLTGGFPCQPYSLAGKRLGTEDERHLWPHMRRAIREIQPTWVVGENVSGFLNWNGGVVFDEVQADLEAAGYEVLPFVLPAAGVGAPHRRDRVWIIAHTTGNRREWNGEAVEAQDRKQGPGYAGKLAGRPEGLGSYGASTHAAGEQGQRHGFEQRASCKSEQGKPGGVRSKVGNEPATSHASGLQLQGGKQSGGVGEAGASQGEGRQPGGSVRGFWEKFPTQSPVCGGDDGLPRELDGVTFSKWRSESIKGYGNAVVPQIPFQIFQAIEITNASL